MKINIIGGGIAGLATAIHLHRQGYNIQIFERVKALGKTGMGFIMLAKLFQKFNIKQQPENLLPVFKEFQALRLPFFQEYERKGNILETEFLAERKTGSDFKIPLS